MRTRFALGLLLLACGRTSLRPGIEDTDAEANGGNSTDSDAGSHTGGPNGRGGGASTGGASGAGVAGTTLLPNGGAPGSGGVTNEAGSGEAGSAPDSPPGMLLEFHELGGVCRSRLLDIARAPNGDIALAGNYCEDLRLDDGPSLLPMADGFDAFVVLLNERFEPRWAWTIEGDYGESVNAVAFLPNGHLLARGSAADRSSIAAELDASGKEVWSWKTLDENQYLPTSVLYDAKLGFVEVGGARASLSQAPFFGPWLLYSGRLDSQGSYVAQNYSLIDGWKETFAMDGAWAAPGEVVTCGWGSVGELKPGYVRRLSSTGTPRFTTLLETDDVVEPASLAVDSAGNLITGGSFRDTLRVGSHELVAPEPHWLNEWLAKLDGDGKPRWLESWHSGLLTRIKSVAVDEQDDILVSGVTNHTLYIRRVSPGGQQRWWLEYEASLLGNIYLITDGPHQLLLAGDDTRASFGPNIVSRQESIYLARLSY